jgi:signal transduction histidine kinase
MSLHVATENGRVLLIDDDLDYHVILSRYLTLAGHEVFTAATGEDGLQAVTRLRPDVVLLDYSLPSMDGLEVCRQLRRDPENEYLPVILLTGHSSIELTEQAVAAGVDDFIDKGAPEQALLVRIHAALRTKRLADVAVQRYDELSFLAEVTDDFNRSLEEDDVLLAAANALSRFEPAALYVLLVPPDEPPALRAYCREAPAFEAPAVQMLVERARAALSSHVEAEELRLFHKPMAWPKPGRGALIGRAIRAGRDMRAYVALQPGAPVDAQAQRIFDGLADRLAIPLENARLYRTIKEKNDELHRTMAAHRRAQATMVQQEKMASIGQLAAGVAHEINNPLAFVISNLNVLGEYVNDLRELLGLYQAGKLREAQQYAERVDPAFLLKDLESLVGETIEGANRVHAIVRDLRTFSHSTNSDTFDEVNLQSIIESTLNILHGELKMRAVVQRDLQPVPTVRGSRSQVGQVILNLVMNAAQAITPDSDGRIVVRLYARMGEVAIEVEDNGCGVPDDQQARIFEPFVTTKRPGEGTGLGLAIVDDIVRRHSGRIDLKSKVGEGSTFTVWLPARSTMPMPKVDLQPGPPDEPEGTALFVDDERFLLSACRRAFGRTVKVLTAQGGEEAIARLQQTPDIDIVLCDLIMPRVSGIDVYGWVRNHRPELLDRFVIVTGGQHGDRSREFLQRTELPVVYKPFNVSEVAQLIKGYVRKRRVPAQSS